MNRSPISSILILILVLTVIVYLIIFNVSKKRKLENHGDEERRKQISNFQEKSFEDDYASCCRSMYKERYGWWDANTIFSNVVFFDEITKKYNNYNINYIGVGRRVPSNYRPRDVLSKAVEKNLYIMRDVNHIYSILYSKKEKKYLIKDSMGFYGGDFVNNFPKGVKDVKCLRDVSVVKQSDASSCGPFTFFNLFREHFKKLGVNVENGSYANKVQTQQIQIISLSFKLLREFIEYEFKNIYPTLCNDIVGTFLNGGSAMNLIVEWQKNLLDRCLSAKSSDEFQNAFDDYQEEIKYYFFEQLLSVCPYQESDSIIDNDSSDSVIDNEKLEDITEFCENYRNKRVGNSIVYDGSNVNEIMV